ncbi:MAG TPA: hypothetical protein VGC06_22255 [Actinomycetes bacterium]
MLIYLGVHADARREAILHEVAMGLGLSLFSAGLTTFAITYFGTSLLEDRMIGAIRTDVQDQLGLFRSTVHDDMVGITDNFERIAPLFEASSRLGIESAYLTRTEALKGFAPYLDAELNKAKALQAGEALQTGGTKERARIWLVSSSMKWFLSTTMDNFDGRQLITTAATFAKGNDRFLDLRILMTHPDRGDERAAQERRREGAIPAEINENLQSLKELGVTPQMVRLYGGTPTVFAIATSEFMLLNPYPYGTEAYRCFCLVIRKTPQEQISVTGAPSDIYQQYEERHFEIPWQHADAVTAELRSPPLSSEILTAVQVPREPQTTDTPPPHANSPSASRRR